MDLGIKGKLALVTGASKGIGKAVCLALAEEGVRVAMVARSKESLEVFIDKKGKEHISLVYDLSKEDAPSRMIKDLTERAGYPDIVINNVGGNLGITDPLCSIEDWRRSYRFNFEIAVEINHLILPYMQKNKWGRIVHMSSIAALENQGSPTYCAMKAALNAYIRSVGRYVSSSGISMSAVMPGAVLTEGGYWDIARKERPDHVKKYLEERMAIKRFGSLDEISRITVFLCSQYAGFIAGSAFLVDGGQGRCFQND
ncbi:MAG: hypothetical protein A2020_07410 [Lentisphaerae bacterium GWF2_45_14]|nr:MAG: hypothetical protein A2020_07410 [Lentisphaerae bacterium GWF2_45_14]